MRYPASEKLEIIWLVERSHLPAKQTLDKLGIPRTTFYRGYALYRAGGEAALKDQASLLSVLCPCRNGATALAGMMRASCPCRCAARAQ